MNCLKSIVAVGLMLAAFTSQAQVGFNCFEGPRSIVVTSPQLITANASNAPIDVRGCMGVAKIDFMVLSNANAGALSVTVNTSADLTNWTAVPNIAIATATAVIYTNNFWLSSLKATNTSILPGTLVTPVAATAGFATSYLSPAPYTNSGAITSFSATGCYEIGFNISDVKRYISVQYTGSTNHTVAAVLTTQRY